MQSVTGNQLALRDRRQHHLLHPPRDRHIRRNIGQPHKLPHIHHNFLRSPRSQHTKTIMWIMYTDRQCGRKCPDSGSYSPSSLTYEFRSTHSALPLCTSRSGVSRAEFGIQAHRLDVSRKVLIVRVMSVATQKGGEGKTTLTIQLAAELSASGSRVLVVDVDPQQSSAWWYEHGPDMNFDLVADTDASLLARLREVDYDIIVVDTPGSLQDASVLEAVLDLSDFVVLPSKATALAIQPLTRTLNELVIPRGLEYRVLANKVDPRSKEGEEYRGARDLYDLLDTAGYAHFTSFLREYKAYEDAAGEGVAVRSIASRGAVKARQDLSDLTRELLTIWANAKVRAGI
jgi:chromosome partitioning protein